VIVLDMLSRGLGVGIISVTVLVGLALEVIDQLTTDGASRADGSGPPARRPSLRALRIALVVLVAASVAATLVRIFVVVR
jgi:hypothetical protein